MIPSLPWGISPPDGANGPVWTARASYSLKHAQRQRHRLQDGRWIQELVTELAATVDLLPDCQCLIGGTADEQAAVAVWLTSTGMPMLRERCTVSRLAPCSADQIRIEDGGFVLVASPQGSPRYLDIGAWRAASQPSMPTSQR